MLFSQEPMQIGQDDKQTEAKTPQGFESAFHIHNLNGKDRAQVESYIATTYQQFYGAQITEFLPLLLSMNLEGLLQAAIGFRPAACGPLFLEQYIENPIEQKVAECLQRPIDRGAMIEIGNLSASKGQSRLLFIVMTGVLSAGLYKWMVFTATPLVKKLIKRLNCHAIYLDQAQPECIGERAQSWGTYYQTNPTVMVMDTQQTLARLQANPAFNQALEEYNETIVTIGSMLRDHRRLCGVEQP